MHTEKHSFFDEDVEEKPFAPLQPTPAFINAEQPRSREDPVAIAEAARMGGTMADFIAKCEAEYAREPSNTYRLGVCRHCEKSLGTREEDKVMDLIPGRAWLPNVCCQPCSDAGKARLAQEARDELSARFMGIIPTEFINWNEKLGNNEALAAARGAFSLENRKGLILHGPSGTGKTFIAWQMVRSVLEMPKAHSWAFHDVYDLASEGIPKEAARVDLLVLDDMGSEATDGATKRKFEAGLLRLIKTRSDWHKTTIVTTQLNGRDFKARYQSGSKAEAILRRLYQRCATIATGTGHA
jgi:DNA replication protein DnaC